jgi:hypothetical protein
VLEKFATLVSRVTRLHDEGKTGKAIIDRATEAKQPILDEMRDAVIAIKLIDSYVIAMEPELASQFGYLPATEIVAMGGDPGIAAPRSQRALADDAARQVLEFAELLKGPGHKQISTEPIIDKLISDGDTRLRPNIGTAVGNILTQSGRWVRIDKGLYKEKKSRSRVGR